MASAFHATRPYLVPSALLVLGIAHVGLLWELQPMATWFYPLAWWPYVVLADWWACKRHHKPTLFFPFSGFLGLCLASLVFWMIFEWINLRIDNWYYVGVPENRLSRWSGISLSFATVLPLLFVTRRLVAPFFRAGSFRVRPVAVTSGLLFVLQGAGLLFLVLPLVFPLQAFPLVWGFLVLMLEPANFRAGRPSLLHDLAEGSARRIVLLLASGLVCGLIWEAWNFRAVGKWIYTVPYFTDTRWFEMPPVGFLGFPPLALAAFVFFSTVRGWWRKFGRAARWAMVTFAVLFWAAGMTVLDRHTVDAPVPAVSGIPVLTEAARGKLAATGLKSARKLAALSDLQVTELADRAGLPEATVRIARDFMRLARHRGMGHANATLLWHAGIRNVRDLARLTPPELERRLGKHAPERRKLSVWIQAAGTPT